MERSRGEEIMNDNERTRWVVNDEALYNWWRSTNKGLTSFVRENRAELTNYINKVLNKEPKQ